jgi:hypothetical protein
VTGMHYYFWAPLALFALWEFSARRYNLVVPEPASTSTSLAPA